MTSTRRLSTIWLALFAMAVATATPAIAEQAPDLEIEGGGWGHGIGMSQYGAYGQALQGRTAEQIVAHYYKGSSTAQIVDQVGASHFLAKDLQPLWVGLLTNKTVFKFKAVGGSLTACQSGAGGCAFTVKPDENWKFVARGDGTCQYFVDDVAAAEPAECQAQVRGMTPGGAHIRVTALETGRNEFARGTVRVRTPNAGNTMHVALEMNLEEYMYGLAEVPFSWHQEALQAQALAGRSYATWRLISRGPEASFPADRKAACWCHMYATTADQSYSGWANEAVSGAGNWKSAVDGTAGKVITHPEATQANVVAAFYSSSTGGRTENNDDMWGGAPVSYLRSQADPWSLLPEVNNPFSTWTFQFSEAALADAYGVDKVDGVEVVERFASGTPKTANVYARVDGKRQKIATSGPDMYTKLGLRGRNVRRVDYGAISGVAADFTGDGREDVAMVTDFSNTWWVGEAKPGTFVEKSWLNHSGNRRLRYRVAGDFNGDGKDDVAALQAGSGKLMVGISTGSKFKLEKWADHLTANTFGPLLVGDFDGDGKDDIAEYDSGPEKWRVYRHKGGAVVKEYWYDFGVSNPNWGSYAVGDYNGDDLDDILTRDTNTGDLIVLFSNGDAFTPSAWQTLPNDGNWQFVQSGDFNGNGRDDIAAFDPASSTWWVIKGLVGERGAVPQMWFTFVNKKQEFIDQVVGDFNGDGKADIAAYVHTNGKLKVLISDGQGFARTLWGKVPARTRVTQVMTVDATGDGRDDVIAWDNERRRWWVAKSQGTEFKVTKWGQLLR